YMAALPIAVFAIARNVERVRRSDRGFSLRTALALMPLALAGIGALGYLRGFGEFQRVEPQTSVMMQSLIQLHHSFDAMDNVVFILYRAHNIMWGDLFFAPTLQYVFIGLIPRFFWPSKPLIFGNQFIMREYIPERFFGVEGEVISPSMAGEMIVSGG